VPTLRDIGMLGPRLRAAFADLGVLDFQQVDIEAVMTHDEVAAAEVDERRRAQVEQTIAAGRESI